LRADGRTLRGVVEEPRLRLEGTPGVGIGTTAQQLVCRDRRNDRPAPPPARLAAREHASRRLRVDEAPPSLLRDRHQRAFVGDPARA
jgi:hypothetical protein